MRALDGHLVLCERSHSRSRFSCCYLCSPICAAALDPHGHRQSYILILHMRKQSPKVVEQLALNLGRLMVEPLYRTTDLQVPPSTRLTAGAGLWVNTSWRAAGPCQHGNQECPGLGTHCPWSAGPGRLFSVFKLSGPHPSCFGGGFRPQLLNSSYSGLPSGNQRTKLRQFLKAFARGK